MKQLEQTVIKSIQIEYFIIFIKKVKFAPVLN